MCVGVVYNSINTDCCFNSVETFKHLSTECTIVVILGVGREVLEYLTAVGVFGSFSL